MAWRIGSRRLAVLPAVLLIGLTRAYGQAPCDVQFFIPALTVDFDFQGNQQFAMSWVPPASGTQGKTYTIKAVQLGSSYCSATYNFPDTAVAGAQTIGVTAATSFVGTYPVPNRVWAIGPLMTGAPPECFRRDFLDSFATPPAKPLLAVATGPRSVIMSYSPNDGRRSSLRIERAGPDGVFQQIGIADDATTRGCETAQNFIDYGGGNAQVGGQLAPGTYRYRARARNLGTIAGKLGVYSDVVTVVIASTARIVVSAFPAGMTQLVGSSGATDSFTISNTGDAPANVTLQRSGAFFTVTPVAFSIPAGGTQTVTITTSPLLAGLYSGSVTVTGDGLGTDSIVVPVKLLVAAAPAAAPKVQPATPRVEVAAPAGQNPSGGVPFTNSGTEGVQGIAVSDVPWLIPQKELVVLAPGQTQLMGFTTDRSKRADGDSPVGGAIGKISIGFLAVQSAAETGIAADPPGGRTSSTVVDVAVASPSAATIPSLRAGDLALFAAGLGTSDNLKDDLLLSNLGQASIRDLRMYLTVSGGTTSFLSSLPPILQNVGILFPSIAKTVFKVSALSSVQLRTADANRLALSATRTVTAGSSAYSTAIPIFRSDRGAANGERLVLPGIEQNDTSGTTLVLQEVAGGEATAQIAFYDDQGTSMGSSDPVSLRGFGVEQVGGVPRSATLAVITNASSAPSRIDAYARIEDTVTKDSWVVVDPTRTAPTAETYVVPFVPPPAGTVTQYDVFLVNGSAAAVTASVEFVGSPRRLRAVNLNRATSTFLSPSLALSPLRTTRGSFSSGAAEGFVRFTAPAGAVMANGRLTSSVPGRAGRSGTALPVLPVSVAIRPGESRRFTGVDDASATTVAARTSGTFRSSLMFVETTGEDATVEVTLRFFFAAGTKVSGQATASRQFTIAAGRSLLIRDLARELIGAQRDKVGDLRNMVLDVTVTTGSPGRVLSWLTSVDNGTDDVITRAE